MKRVFCASAIIAVAVLGFASMALADVSASVSEIGTSGQQSSYYANSPSNNDMTSNWFTTMPTLSSQLVNYTDGSTGTVPSPGMNSPAEAAQFDQGTLALNISGGQVKVTLTTAMSPTAGYFDNGYWQRWYGQGDVFLSVDNAGAVKQYALLNNMPTVLDDGSFDAARNFRSGTGATAATGDLVELGNTSQVAYIAGNGSYSATGGYGPDAVGLDGRIYAQGGTPVGDGTLSITSTPNSFGYDGQSVTWYTETWTFAEGDLGAFDEISLHSATTCGNDQIGLDSGLITSNGPRGGTVPAPAAVLLGVLGLAGIGALKRRFA
jgi:hypothetical protein